MDVLLKQIDKQQEEINCLKRSAERRQQSLLEEQTSCLDMINIIGHLDLYLDKKKSKSILFKWIYNDIINNLEELKERFDYYE